MFQSLINTLFGCSHTRTTFPMSRKSAALVGPGATRTYVACLDCGKEIAYDWDAMRIGEPVRSGIRAAEAEPVTSRP